LLFEENLKVGIILTFLWTLSIPLSVTLKHESMIALPIGTWKMSEELTSLVLQSQRQEEEEEEEEEEDNQNP